MNREGHGQPGEPGQPDQAGQPSSVAAETLEPGKIAMAAKAAAAGPAAAGSVPDGPPTRWQRLRTALRGQALPPGPLSRPAAGHALLLAVYLAAGIAVTWPRVTYLADGLVPARTDVASYVWDFYWVAHQVSHLGSPFFTRSMAAPVGIRLGFDTLMPLPGLVMTPVTLAFSPAISFSILTIIAPGLLCYLMYRAARLWLAIPGSIAAGALFGLSAMLTWQNWYHLNIALGSLFLPMTLEAAIRLRRRPALRYGIILGAVLGASVLVNQESAVLAVLLAAAVLVPWLIAAAIRDRRAARAGLRSLCAGAALAAVIATPQLIAMANYELAGGAISHPATVGAITPVSSHQQLSALLAPSYRLYGAGLPTMFSPSPRLANFGIGHLWSSAQGLLSNFTFGHLSPIYSFNQGEGMPTFGAVLTILGLAGLILAWRRGSTWWFALLWLAGAALALGPTLQIGSRTYVPLEVTWNGQHMSGLMPYFWLIRIPGLSALREADRLTILGLIGAALLAGCTVDWLCRRRRTWPVLAVIAALAALEAGWSPGPGTGQTIPAAAPALDQPIARDHSRSIVLDIPYGLRGGIPLYGDGIAIRPLLLATSDGHPRAISYSSWVPGTTAFRISRHPFYNGLVAAQAGVTLPGPQLAAARADLASLHIGWALIWRSQRPSVLDYLVRTGFRYDYQVDGVTVLRPQPVRPPPHRR